MININDIIKRSNYINLNKYNENYNRYHKKLQMLLESSNRLAEKRFILQHWNGINEDEFSCFKNIIDLLDEAYEKNNKNDFNYIKSYIINEVTPTVRDSKQFSKYLKYKSTRIKNKISEKVKKNVEDIKDTGNKLVNDTKNSNVEVLSKVKDNMTKNLKKDDIKEAYIEIIEALEKYDHCDRILENVNIIQKRFNILNMVEKIDVENEAQLTVFIDSIYECIDTYNADISTKFNSVLETCFYCLGRKNKNYNKSLVLEQTVNNFISKKYTDKDLINIKSIIESSPVIGLEDKINVEYLYNESNTENIDYNIAKIIEASDLVMDLDILNESIKDKKNEVKEIINNFKLNKNPKPSDPRTAVSKMFTKSADQIIDGTPNFLSWIRMTWVLGAATAIHPILGAISLFVDLFIAQKLRRRDVSKMITVFKNERTIISEKMKKVDDQEKKNLKDYDKYLKNGIEKMKEYEESLMSSGEIESDYSKDEYNKDTDLDFLSNDDIFESTSFQNLIEKSNFFSKKYFTENIEKNLSSMDEDTIDTIIEVACKYPVIINTNRLYSILNEELENIKNSHYKNWVRMSCITSNIRKLKESMEIITTDDTSDVFDIINGLEDLFIEYSIKTESVSTTIKVITNKIRKSLQKASDIDKEASRKIDSAVNMFISGIQRSVKNDNREAIIKGSILPSASKIVKAAIVDGGIALINPALAIILALGQFAMSKKMKIKERQLVLDEIDIELEMTKRYLRQAEDQNDLEAQKRLLKIQRNLERQKQRIEYNIKINWNQDVPSPNKDDD